MSRRLLLVLFLNAVVSAGVAFGIISMFGRDSGELNERLVTFEVVITATLDPNYTPPVILITTTPDPNLPARANIPPEVIDGTAVAQGVPTSTVDPALLDEVGNFIGGMENLPEACVIHSVADGEFPSLIAQQYTGVSYFDILTANDLTEEDATFLQIGDLLIIPLAGCPLELFIDVTAATEAAQVTDENTASTGSDETPDGEGTEDPEATEDLSPSATPTATPIPTITLAPTASNAQVTIVEVINPGDITTEAVIIRNDGNLVDISGWTISDAEGNTYTFAQGKRLFSGGSLTINTRAGADTAILYFWNQDTAVFGDGGEAGEAVVLTDANGVVQASLRVP